MFTNWKDEVDNWNKDIINTDDVNKERLYEKLRLDDINKIHLVQGQSDQEKTQVTDIITFENMIEIITNKIFKNISDFDNLNNVLKVLNWCSNKDYNDYIFVKDENSIVNKTNDITVFLDVIDWICLAFYYFILELKIPEIKDRVYTGLVRSSYKLCPQKSNCCYQYPDDENALLGCKNQHYPYANLYVDAMSIKIYINNYINKNNDSLTSKLVSVYTQTTNPIQELNINELKRCLSTLHYVILIMFRELETILKYRSSDDNFNIRKFHKYHAMHRFKKKTDHFEQNQINDNVIKKPDHIFEREIIPNKTYKDIICNGQSQKLLLLKEAQKTQQLHYATHRNVKLRN